MIETQTLSRIPEVRHGFFTRRGGCSQGLYATLNCSYGSGDDPETVTRNRAHVATVLGLAGDRLAVAAQCHSAEVAVVEEPWDRAHAPRVDGLVTRRRDVAIAVTTADCAPILFADEDGGVIGAAHAGWRGALSGVTDATIAQMEKLGARRRSIVAAIGPTISRAAYEVGAELRQKFHDTDAQADRFFSASERAGHFMLDLPAYLQWRLLAAGIGSVEATGHCTYEDDARFFSYRRTTHRNEKIYGCQLSAITFGPDTFMREG
jgi:hypothetical protein